MDLIDKIERRGQSIGYETLKPEQLEVIKNYFMGRDCLLVAPTGWGKSVLFQIAPLLFDSSKSTEEPSSVVLVIVPTISLAQDATMRLCTFLPSTMTAVHLTRATVMAASEASYIFTSPESLLSPHVGLNLLRDPTFCRRVKAVFVDECHIIQTWGSSQQHKVFREDFYRLNIVRSHLPNIPCVAITATAPVPAMQFVMTTLEMKDVHRNKVNINKSNIMYHVTHFEKDDEENFQWLAELLHEMDKQMPRTLVFFTSLRKAAAVMSYITDFIGQEAGECDGLVALYTKLTSHHNKERVIVNMNIDSKLRVVLCTSSLAVGVNLKDIQYIVHYGTPSTAMNYLQETGRAAREQGSSAHAVIMTFPRMTIQGTDENIRQLVAKSCSMCRRRILLQPFNIVPHTQEKCCDICQSSDDYLVQRVVALSRRTSTGVTVEVVTSSSEASLTELPMEDIE